MIDINNMKALSVRQPWAWAIFNGKDIENRTWKTDFRGPLLIHAGKKFDEYGYHWLLDAQVILGLDIPEQDEFERGGIIGSVNITGVVTSHKSLWFSGPYGFTIADAKPLKMIQCPGNLKFFKPRPTGSRE